MCAFSKTIVPMLMLPPLQLQLTKADGITDNPNQRLVAIAFGDFFFCCNFQPLLHWLLWESATWSRKGKLRFESIHYSWSWDIIIRFLCLCFCSGTLTHLISLFSFKNPVPNGCPQRMTISIEMPFGFFFLSLVQSSPFLRSFSMFFWVHALPCWFKSVWFCHQSRFSWPLSVRWWPSTYPSHCLVWSCPS